MKKLLLVFKTKTIQIFTHGLSPFQLAITLSFGITLGLFPFIGMTSILCFVFAIVFKLNLVVIQLINWLVSPLQLIMLVPFYQLGNFFKQYFHSSTHTVVEKVQVLKQNYFDKFLVIIDSQILAILGWAVFCVPFAIAVHFISLFIYKKYLNRKKIVA